MLVEILKIGGTTALSIAVFYRLYRQMIASGYFSPMSGTQTFAFFTVISVLIFFMLNLVFSGPIAVTWGDGNTTIQ